jgi:DnaJ like chaperone protein
MGKVIGCVLGFAFKGPMGAVIGFLIGHVHDSRTANPIRSRAYGSAAESAPYPGGLMDGLQQSTFTIGVIVLGAKMAKADGRVSREEIATFRRVFHIPDSQLEEVGRLFDQARLTSGGYEPYAARLAQVFRRNPAVLEEILTGLFLVAVADRTGLSPPKSNFLRRIAILFGFTEEDFARIAARSGVRLPDEPAAAKKEEAYVVLGLPENAPDADIKRTYRALIRKHHPDKLVAQGLPPELINQATEKMKRINAAYDRICKARGIK